jgi:prepilin-type N-terminal cleavage/methylation domain-containing protein
MIFNYKAVMQAFTINELLIALAVIGIIATMTLPTFIAQISSQGYKTGAKRHAAAMAEAYVRASYESKKYMENLVPNDVLPYLSFIERSSSAAYGTHDRMQVSGPRSWTCQQSAGVGHTCLVLQDGAVAQFENATSYAPSGWVFLGTYDPDGLRGSAIRIGFWMKVDTGRIVSQSTKPFTAGHSTYDTTDPVWFSWY